jgi:hypothetical protein
MSVALIATSVNLFAQDDDFDDDDWGMPQNVDELIDNVIDEMELEANEDTALRNFIDKNFPSYKKELETMLMDLGNDMGEENLQDENFDEEEMVEEIYEYVFDEMEEINYMLFEVQKEDPAMFAQWLKFKKLDQKTLVLGYEIEKAIENGDKATVEAKSKELKKLLPDLFDMRLKMEKEEVKELEEELDELKSEIEFREKNKAKIIEKYYKELTGGEDDRLNW